MPTRASSAVDGSPFVGVTRREFLKFCSATAALIGVSSIGVPEVAAALEQLARRPQVIWSSFQVCTGCAISFLECRTPPVAQLILQQISVEYQDNVMAAAGIQAEEQRNKIVESGDFYWVVEGCAPEDPRCAHYRRPDRTGDHEVHLSEGEGSHRHGKLLLVRQHPGVQAQSLRSGRNPAAAERAGNRRPRQAGGQHAQMSGQRRGPGGRTRLRARQQRRP